jgi:hypothetical protein
MDDIFISIAAYRDPELLPTVIDLFEKAKDPSRLSVCICWQYGEDIYEQEFLSEIVKRGYSNIKLLKVPHTKSKGVCWARSIIQQYYNNEKYSMQLDSHHRFVENWDQKLVSELKKLLKQGIKKPLLTAYIPSYEPSNDPDGRINLPWELKFDRFLPQGPAMPRPETIDDYKDLKKPVPAHLLSGHFIFTIGQHIEDVPYDPDFYFHGEEISMAIRSYTSGYDMFYPHRVIIWHQYTRAGATRHWDDYSGWNDQNEGSHSRYRQLVGQADKTIDFGKYDIGTERSLQDYIEFSGINVSNKTVHPDTIAGKRVPVKYSSKNKKRKSKEFTGFFKYCIDLLKADIKVDDCDCWVVAFKNEAGDDLYRQDCDENEIKRYQDENPDDQWYRIWRWYETTDEYPVNWIVWPHSKSKGWVDPIIRPIHSL